MSSDIIINYKDFVIDRKDDITILTINISRPSTKEVNEFMKEYVYDIFCFSCFHCDTPTSCHSFASAAPSFFFPTLLILLLLHHYRRSRTIDVSTAIYSFGSAVLTFFFPRLLLLLHNHHRSKRSKSTQFTSDNSITCSYREVLPKELSNI